MRYILRFWWALTKARLRPVRLVGLRPYLTHRSAAKPVVLWSGFSKWRYPIEIFRVHLPNNHLCMCVFSCQSHCWYRFHVSLCVYVCMYDAEKCKVKTIAPFRNTNHNLITLTIYPWYHNPNHLIYNNNNISFIVLVVHYNIYHRLVLPSIEWHCH